MNPKTITRTFHKSTLPDGVTADQIRDMASKGKLTPPQRVVMTFKKPEPKAGPAAKTLNRAAFDLLSHRERTAFFRAGGKLTA
jgi:hypothetical protein